MNFVMGITRFESLDGEERYEIEIGRDGQGSTLLFMSRAQTDQLRYDLGQKLREGAKADLDNPN